MKSTMVAVMMLIIALPATIALADEPQHHITYFKDFPSRLVSKGESPERTKVIEVPTVNGISGEFSLAQADNILHITAGGEINCRAKMTGKDVTMFWVLARGTDRVEIAFGPEVMFRNQPVGDYSVTFWATNTPGNNTRYSYTNCWRVKVVRN